MQFRLCHVRTSGRSAEGLFPDRRWEGTSRDGSARSVSIGATLTGHQADVPVDDNRCCVRQMPPATARRLMLQGGFESKIVSQENPRPRLPSVAAPSRAKRSCNGCASRIQAIAATAGSRREPTRSAFRQPSQASLLAGRRTGVRTRPILSTTIRPAFGRAVLRRPRGDERRPRANRSSRD